MRGDVAAPAAAEERLDASAIRDAMGDATNRLAALELVEHTGSTNQDLLDRPAAAVHRVARLAEQQTRGRGRRGRGWFSPRARNLYLSLGWRFGNGPVALGHLPLVTALAVARALAAIGHAGHGVKWPNDLVTEDGKLGGCLVELHGGRDGTDDACTAVLGIGLNVRLAGVAGLDAIDQPWDDLASRLPGASRNTVAGAVLSALTGALHEFAAAGFAPFEADWARYDVLAGQAVAVRGERETVSGTCRGLGPRGGLLVQAGTAEPIEVFAGEASVRRAL
jgi:BirA family biotin operon repressor/biotin-[acetyl-CoA-carboxylase] ligase